MYIWSWFGNWLYRRSLENVSFEDGSHLVRIEVNGLGYCPLGHITILPLQLMLNLLDKIVFVNVIDLS